MTQVTSIGRPRCMNMVLMVVVTTSSSVNLEKADRVPVRLMVTGLGTWYGWGVVWCW